MMAELRQLFLVASETPLRMISPDQLFLMSAVTRLARGSVEAGNVKTYRLGLNKFTAFVNGTCAGLGRPPWPLRTVKELRDLVSSKGVEEVFIAYAHEDGMRSNSIDVYIAALKFWGTDGYGRPVLPDRIAVKRLLQGCEKAQGPQKDGKLEFDIIRLRKLIYFLGRKGGRSVYDVSRWRAMFCAAFLQLPASLYIWRLPTRSSY